MTVNNRQVGGEHYQATIQHWDLVEDNGIGYIEGNATKYLTRWKKKNGVQDLEKAKHYIHKLIEVAQRGRMPRGEVPGIILRGFILANEVDEIEAKIIRLLVKRWDFRDLLEAGDLIQELINAVTAVSNEE